ncbi:MAG: coenzyme F420 hydrogenase/dehydrogenase beta subunit N-terminal domain-containing protein, partial [Pseudomonadota bacterium]
MSQSRDPAACGRACQFIKPDYPRLETAVHGRARGDGDEVFFGPFQAMYRARMAQPRTGAQWTGITTSLAAVLLENGSVEAV